MSSPQVNLAAAPSIEGAIIKTLTYRDLFDYPLTAEEVHRFLIQQNSSREMVENTLEKMVIEEGIGEKEGWYFLPGRQKITQLRREREAISREKLAKISRYTRILCVVPWVQAVFVTGAVAVGNAEEKSDLDLLIVTAPERLWLARFFVFLILIVLGVKRKRGPGVDRDKVCPNMFFTTKCLALPKSEQNLYTAHEAVQARLVWERDLVHQRFLAENHWIKKFLPNVKLPSKVAEPRVGTGFPPLGWLERVVYWFQLKYMAKKRTKEIVTPERILFHAVDLPTAILTAYRQRLQSVSPTGT